LGLPKAIPPNPKLKKGCILHPQFWAPGENTPEFKKNFEFNDKSPRFKFEFVASFIYEFWIKKNMVVARWWLSAM
jgi:hypothetical protein